MPPILTQQAFLKATATSFFFFASLNCFFLLPLYIEQLGGTEVAVGAVMGIYRVPSMFMQAAGVALLAALAFLVSRVRGLPPLPVLFVVGLTAGGAHGFLYPGLAALVADQAHETRRGAVIGVFSAVFLIGNSGGAFLFGYVAHRFGYGVMWSTLAALLLAGALLSLGLPDHRHTKNTPR